MNDLRTSSAAVVIPVRIALRTERVTKNTVELATAVRFIGRLVYDIVLTVYMSTRVTAVVRVGRDGIYGG